MFLTENDIMENDSTRLLYEQIKERDGYLAEVISADGVDSDALQFISVHLEELGYNQCTADLISMHASAEWFKLCAGYAAKNVQVEIINAKRAGLPLEYVADYLTKTDDPMEFEKFREEYRQDVQDSEDNIDMDAEDKPEKNERDENKNSLFAEFIERTTGIDMSNASKRKEDDAMMSDLLNKVTCAININKERNDEISRLMKIVSMYKEHSAVIEADIDELKKENEKLKAEVERLKKEKEESEKHAASVARKIKELNSLGL